MLRDLTPHTYTKIDMDEGEAIYVCNDCGAYGDAEDEVVHHQTCHPGESAYWQAMYDQADEEVEDGFDPELYANHQYDEVDFGEDDVLD